VEKGDLQQVASQVARLHLVKTRLSGSTRRKLKKVRENQGGTGAPQQPGHVASPKLSETQTRVPKEPRSEGSNPVKENKPFKMPRDLMGPGTYREAVMNVRIAVLKDDYPVGELSEEEQDLILADNGRDFKGIQIDP
jgi:hypothetical protein